MCKDKSNGPAKFDRQSGLFKAIPITAFKIGEDKRACVDGWLSSVDEAIRIETEELNRVRSFVKGVSDVIDKAAKIQRLAAEIGTAWNEMEPFFTAHAVGDSAAVFKAAFVSPYVDADGGNKAYVPDESTKESIKHLCDAGEKNVIDLKELKTLLSLIVRLDDVMRLIERTDVDRRTALARELKRTAKKLTECCPSILNGRFSSPNVDRKLSDAIGKFAETSVENAREIYNALKRVA